MRFGSADAEPAFGVQIDFESEKLEPGDAADVSVRTWADDKLAVAPSMKVFLYEGGKRVGTVRCDRHFGCANVPE